MKALFLFFLSVSAFALESGKPAPDFTAKTSDGKTVKLSDYKGKPVVLEWFSFRCNFVKKHYFGKNMPALQAEYTAKGAVWFTVTSSAEGKEGYSTPEKAESVRKRFGSNATAVILDSKGELGRLYGAKTTPQIFVIDGKGVLAYQGAVDDRPSDDIRSLDGARSYVRDALDAVLAGKTPPVTLTKSYGCAVRY